MGSARISRAGFGVIPNNLSIGGAGIGREMLKEKFATAKTRALPFRSEFGSSDDARWDKP
jgi:hypothetical protein